jgi:hypothetical protein
VHFHLPFSSAKDVSPEFSLVLEELRLACAVTDNLVRWIMQLGNACGCSLCAGCATRWRNAPERWRGTTEDSARFGFHAAGGIILE